MRTIHVKLGVLHGGGEVDATLLLPPEGDGGRLLVEADAKAFQLVLYQLLVRDGLEAVEHDQDEVACPGSGNDLPTIATMSPITNCLEGLSKGASGMLMAGPGVSGEPDLSSACCHYKM